MCGSKSHVHAESEIPAHFFENVSTELKRIIKELYKGNEIITDTKLLSLVGSVIEKQVFDNFGNDFISVDFDTPDGAMLTRLTRDVWQFSSAKNYQELRDLTNALLDENGRIRTFPEFREAATKIDEKYNNTWLKVEHSTAIGSSTMAARWNEYLEDAESMPFLMYETVGDSNVRTDHQLLDGIVRKIIDSFWKTHYPPNGWGCRCNARQLSTSTAKETEQIPNIYIPKMFQTNLAETGLIFPKEHPYYEGVPKDVLTRSIAYLPNDVAYKNVYKHEASGGSVDTHILHGANTEHEIADNIRIAKSLADKGHTVKLLPSLEGLSDDVREKLYGNNFIANKNPDAHIDNEIFEFKTATGTKSSIQNAIRRISKQANKGVVKLNEAIEDKLLERLIIGKLKQSLTISEIWVITKDNQLKQYTRSGLGL